MNNEQRPSKERIQALRKLFDERHNLSRPPHREWRTAHTEELLRIAEDLQRAADEPSAAPVEAFQALQKRSRAWAQSKIDEQTNFTEAHRLALVIGFQAGWTGRPAEPPSVAAEILRKRLEQNEDLLLRAGKLLRQYAEFGGDDHSVGVCNCSDMRLVEEIEIRLGRIGCTRDAETKSACLAETAEGKPLERCTQYPACPCGGPPPETSEGQP